MSLKATILTLFPRSSAEDAVIENVIVDASLVHPAFSSCPSVTRVKASARDGFVRLSCLTVLNVAMPSSDRAFLLQYSILSPSLMTTMPVWTLSSIFPKYFSCSRISACSFSKMPLILLRVLLNFLSGHFSSLKRKFVSLSSRASSMYETFLRVLEVKYIPEKTSVHSTAPAVMRIHPVISRISSFCCIMSAC